MLRGVERERIKEGREEKGKNGTLHHAVSELQP